MDILVGEKRGRPNSSCAHRVSHGKKKKKTYINSSSVDELIECSRLYFTIYSTRPSYLLFINSRRPASARMRNSNAVGSDGRPASGVKRLEFNFFFLNRKFLSSTI